jgi:hypothetical protein
VEKLKVREDGLTTTSLLSRKTSCLGYRFVDEHRFYANVLKNPRHCNVFIVLLSFGNRSQLVVSVPERKT